MSPTYSRECPTCHALIIAEHPGQTQCHRCHTIFSVQAHHALEATFKARERRSYWAIPSRPLPYTGRFTTGQLAQLQAHIQDELANLKAQGLIPAVYTLPTPIHVPCRCTVTYEASEPVPDILKLIEDDVKRGKLP